MNMKQPDQKLVDSLYTSMLRTRLIEEAIAEIYPMREMRTPTHLYIGQEAIASGTCEALRKDDFVYGYYRSHGWYLAKGGNLDRMMAELFGKATGCSKGYGGSMHLIDLEAGFTGTTAIVAGAVPHAVGAAFTFKSRKTGQVAVTAFGDGATEEGVLTESLMFAALRKLPVIFICENNGLATNTLLKDRQPATPIYQRAGACGLPALLIDGNNALEVFETVQKAVARARAGEGPTFIECTTYRYFEHCGPNYDVSLGHRTMEEVEEWRKKDPVAFLEKKIDPTLKARIRQSVQKEFEASVEAARKAPFPTSLIPEGMTCQY